MVTKEIPNFSLRQIADSGQCFRMKELTDGSFFIVSGSQAVTVSQEGKRTAFSCSSEEFPFWERYFDLAADYSAYIAAIPARDKYLTRAAQFGSGIRILQQNPWEMIITFIISQQKTIPNIKALVEALCERYGTELSPGVYSFPTPRQLNRASLEDLLDLKLGYRAKYIRRVCEDACAGNLDLKYLETLKYPAALAYLQSFYGIGEKVANCICLFGLHHTGAFPVDTWIRKILLKEYAPKFRQAAEVPQSRLCEALIGKYFSRYKGYAGVMQQYIFYYERMGNR